MENARDEETGCDGGESAHHGHHAHHAGDHGRSRSARRQRGECEPTVADVSNFIRTFVLCCTYLDLEDFIAAKTHVV